MKVGTDDEHHHMTSSNVQGTVECMLRSERLAVRIAWSIIPECHGTGGESSLIDRPITRY